jgi:hypothetical protein
MKNKIKFKNDPPRCPWPSQINHTKWPCLIKLVILIWLANLLVMPTKQPIYLLTYLNLPMSYLPTYLPTIYLPISYLPTTIYLLFTKVTYLFTYLPILNLFIHLPSIYLVRYLLTYL